MNKLIVGLLWLTLLSGSAYAGSAIVRADRVKVLPNDIPTADNPAWSGVTYNGYPALYAQDAVALNRNYLTQVVLTKLPVGGRVRIDVSGQGANAYNLSFANYTTRSTNPVLGLGTSFQPSGIVVSASAYKYSGFTPFILVAGSAYPNWQIANTFEFNQSDYDSFVSKLNTWNQTYSVFPNVKTQSTQTFYTK